MVLESDSINFRIAVFWANARPAEFCPGLVSDEVSASNKQRFTAVLLLAILIPEPRHSVKVRAFHRQPSANGWWRHVALFGLENLVAL